MDITVKHKGDLKNTMKYLQSSRKTVKMKEIETFIEVCIKRLKEATPVKTGLTAESWTYTINREKNSVSVFIENTNIQNGINIAILIDTGHMTKSGTYITGLHFIDPVILDTYNQIIENTWKELKSL